MLYELKILTRDNQMPNTKTNGFYIAFITMTAIMVVLNEIGYGVLSLTLLFPTCLILARAILKEPNS